MTPTALSSSAARRWRASSGSAGSRMSIHCHDWHTAIVPNWLKTIYKDDPFYANTACVYTIHNLAYQGIFGYRVLEIAGVDEFGFIAHPDMPHLNDVVDFMGRGIYYADIINTVSETYANEILTPEFGEGLDPLLRDRRDRLYGVLNGIDTEINNPATDQLSRRALRYRQPGRQSRMQARSPARGRAAAEPHHTADRRRSRAWPTRKASI